MAQNFTSKMNNSGLLKIHAANATRGNAVTRLPASSRKDEEENKPKTYTLNTGDRQYTITQDQYDGIRELYKRSWEDAYSYDDEDQARKSAGIMPRAYEQSYKNYNYDRDLYSHNMPPAKYMDQYLEAYEELKAEQDAYSAKANAKSQLYYSAAQKDLELELQGIYNDDKLYDWNGEQRSGKDIYTDTFFDLVNSGDFADVYVYDNSQLEKDETDFDNEADWREYQLKQSQKAFDQQSDWDDAVSVSYDDYLENYSTKLSKELKAQKIVGDAMGRTYGQAVEDNETIRESELYSSLTTDNAVDDFVYSHDEDPATAISNMYQYGVEQGKITRAKNKYLKIAQTDEEKEAIKSAFDSGRQARREEKIKQQQENQTDEEAVRGIFNNLISYNGAVVSADSLQNAVDEALNKGYSETEIAAVATDLKREFAQLGMLGYDADRVLTNAIHPEREKNKAADTAVQEIITEYEKEMEPPEQSVDKITSLILSNLEYDGMRVTDESIQAAMESAVATGESYAVLRKAAVNVLENLGQRRALDTSASTIPSIYTGNYTTKEIIDNALASAKQEDEKILAEKTREALSEQGYTEFEIDQAFRRNGWSGLIDDESAAKNYFVEVAMPRELESSETALGDMSPADYALSVWDSMTDEERAEYVASFQSSQGYNTDLNRTYGEQAITQFTMILPRVLTDIASGVVNVADMASSLFSDRTDRWEISKTLSEASAIAGSMGKSANQDAMSDFISGANDVATEVLRMYTLNYAGSGLSKVFSTPVVSAAVPGATSAAANVATSAAVKTASSKGFGKILDVAKYTFSTQSAPFVATAMGSYYAEAMDSGATKQQAVLYGLVAGTAEGALEALNTDNWVKNRFGGQTFINQIQAAGKNALRQGYASNAKLLSLVSSAFGEGIEEASSYLVSTLMQKATYSPDATFSFDEMVEQASMGALIGVFGAGASIASGNGAYTETGMLYNYLLENGYDANVADALFASLQYDLMDENIKAYAEKSPDILSIDEYKSHMTTIDQANKAIETANANVQSAIKNATADIDAKSSAVRQLEERIASVNLNTTDGAKEVARLTQELVAARGRLKNAIATSESTVQKAIDSMDASTIQNQRAAEKAKSDLNKHFVGMMQTLSPIIQQMDSSVVGMLEKYAYDAYGAEASQATLDEAISMYNKAIENATFTLAETMANIRAGVVSETKSLNGVDSVENVAYNTQVGGKENGTGLQEASGRTVPGNAGEESQTGTDGTVSGSVVADVYPRMAQEVSGVERRENYRILGTLVKDELTKRGKDPIDFRTDVDPSSFYAAIGEAKQENEHGAFVTQHEVEEYANMQLFLDDTKGVGVAVTSDGDIVSVFKNPGTSRAKGSVSSILLTAIQNGGVKLDNFDGWLSDTYYDHGFIPVARTAFVDEYAPDDWNYERDGRPDIIFWIHNGESVEQIAKTLGTREMPDLSQLPLMDYEEAAKYRDSLLANRNETLTSSAITSFDTGDVSSKSGTVASMAEENTSGGGDALLNAQNNGLDTLVDDSENLGIVNKSVSETLSGMKRFGRSFYRKVVSGTQETERAAKLQTKLDSGAVNLTESAQLVRTARGTGQSILFDSLTDTNGQEVAPAFRTLFDSIPDSQYGDFQNYLLHRHNVDRMSLEERGFGNNKPVLGHDADADGNQIPYTSAESQSIIEQIENEHPEWSEIASKIDDWWNSFMRKWMLDGGLISQESYDAMREMYPHYVPTYRTEGKGVGAPSYTGMRAATIANVVRSATGATDSVRDIRDSFSDIIMKTVSAERKNEFALNLYNFAAENPIAAREYAAIVEDADSSANVENDFDAAFDDLLSENLHEVKDGKYVVRAFKDGQRVEMAVSSGVYDAFDYLFGSRANDSFSARSIDSFLRGLRKASSVFKAGITVYNPFFGLTNTVRDFQTAFVNTDASALGFFRNLASAAENRAKKSEKWKNFQALGGNSSGYISSQLGYSKSIADANRPIKKATQKIGSAMSFFGEYTENLFRFAEYLEGIRKYGDTPEGRRKALNMSADVTTNFSRSAPVTKAIDSFVLYLNAQVQGLDKMARQIKNKPLKTVARTVPLMAIAAILRYGLGNDENPHYQNLSNYVKDNNYLIPNVLGGRDDNGFPTTFIKLPKSREYGALLVALFERCCRFADGEDFNTAFDEYTENVKTNFDLSLQGFWTPILDAIDNKNFYGSDIVPQYMLDDPVTEQKNAQTSLVSSAISERLHEMGVDISPMQLDYIATQFGFYGSLLVSATAADAGDPATIIKNIWQDKFVADPLYSSGIVGRFYDSLDEAKAAASDAADTNKTKYPTVDESAYSEMNDLNKQISELRKQERSILAEERDTPARKKKIDDIRRQINELAAMGVEVWAGRRYR